MEFDSDQMKKWTKRGRNQQALPWWADGRVCELSFLLKITESYNLLTLQLFLPLTTSESCLILVFHYFPTHAQLSLFSNSPPTESHPALEAHDQFYFFKGSPYLSFFSKITIESFSHSVSKANGQIFLNQSPDNPLSAFPRPAHLTESIFSNSRLCGLLCLLTINCGSSLSACPCLIFV